jgi:hypothetical protein
LKPKILEQAGAAGPWTPRLSIDSRRGFNRATAEVLSRSGLGKAVAPMISHWAPHVSSPQFERVMTMPTSLQEASKGVFKHVGGGQYMQVHGKPMAELAQPAAIGKVAASLGECNQTLDPNCPTMTGRRPQRPKPVGNVRTGLDTIVAHADSGMAASVGAGGDGGGGMGGGGGGGGGGGKSAGADLFQAQCELEEQEYDHAIKRADDRTKVVAVDLDGTLATYDGWKGEEHFGTLRKGAKKAMKEFQAKGYHIIIHTTRGNKELVKKWLNDNDVPFDYINENPNQPEGSSSKPIADVYIDDRAIPATQSWDKIRTEVMSRLTKSGYQMTPTLLKQALGTVPYDYDFRAGSGVDLINRMQDYARQQGMWQAASIGAQADRPTYHRTMKGLSRIFGVQPSEDFLHSATGDVAKAAPYLSTLVPGLWEMLHGPKGSTANLARNLHASGEVNPLTAGMMAGQMKFSADHGKQVVVINRHEGEVCICPHCNCEIKDKDIYRDAKGWTFHRPCFMKGKGSIRMPLALKKAADSLDKDAGLKDIFLSAMMLGGQVPGSVVDALPHHAKTNIPAHMMPASPSPAPEHSSLINEYRPKLTQPIGPPPIPQETSKIRLPNRTAKTPIITQLGKLKLPPMVGRLAAARQPLMGLTRFPKIGSATPKLMIQFLKTQSMV